MSTPLVPSLTDTDRTETLASFLAACERGELVGRLAAHGLDASKAVLFQTAAHSLADAGIKPTQTVAAFWVPGRIEVLGKHTDYAGGRSLLVAATRGFAVLSVDREDTRLRVHASFALAGHKAVSEIDLAPDANCADELPASDWAIYPAAVARRLARNFGVHGGIELAFGCDLPEASGMSSSSAVVCLTLVALARRNRLSGRARFKECLTSAEELCHYLGCCENGQSCGDVLLGDKGVGTFGGSEDHTAIMCSNPNEMRQYSFCPTRCEAIIPMPSRLRFVIAVSGATAHKASDRLADYNNAALLARWAAHAASFALEAANQAEKMSQEDAQKTGQGSAVTLASLVRASPVTSSVITKPFFSTTHP
jgi:galactokinase